MGNSSTGEDGLYIETGPAQLQALQCLWPENTCSYLVGWDFSYFSSAFLINPLKAEMGPELGLTRGRRY